MSLNISDRARIMPASAIRKLVPLADAAKARGIKVYHLNVGAPDIKSPDCAVNAVMDRCRTMHHLSYTNSAGLMELREGLVNKYYKKIGIDIEVPELLVEVAGSEAFACAMQIAANPGDEIIVVEPYYTNYQTFAYLNGITLKAVHSDIRQGFAIPDISAFEKVLTDRTRAVLISNPCNPSGKLFTRDEMLAIGEFCRRHDLFFICDEVYREFCYTDEPHFSALNIPGCEQNVIMVDSVSKRYNLCGARIGCIISHNKDVMAAAMKFAQSRLCPPVLGQYAAIGALDTPQSYFDEVKAEYIRRRDCAVRRLNEIPGVYAPTPMGAFMVTPAASFYTTPDAGKKHIRLAYVLEVPELEKALHILAEGLAKYSR